MDVQLSLCVFLCNVTLVFSFKIPNKLTATGNVTSFQCLFRSLPAEVSRTTNDDPSTITVSHTYNQHAFTRCL